MNRGRFRTTVLSQELLGPLREHPPNFTTLPFYSWNAHGIVGRRLVPHPRNDRSFGALIDGNSLGTGNSPAADRRCVIGHSTGELSSNFFMSRMKIEEAEHRVKKVVDILGVSLLSATNIGSLAFGILLG